MQHTRLLPCLSIYVDKYKNMLTLYFPSKKKEAFLKQVQLSIYIYTGLSFEKVHTRDYVLIFYMNKKKCAILI